MLAKPLVMMGAIEAPINPGDIADFSEPPLLAITLSGALTLTGAQLVNGDIIFTGGSAHTATLPTADALIAELIGSINKVTPPANSLYMPTQNVTLQWPANVRPLGQGASFRRTMRNENSGTTTLAAQASSGVTISGTATWATATWIEWLIRILNSSPTAIIPVTTTNASLVLSNVNPDIIANVVPGMSAYGTGIGSAAIVDAVNLDARTIHVTVASTATADNIPVTFTPTVIFQRIRGGTN